MCNNTQEKKAAGAGEDFTPFFGVMLHFNFKCVRTQSDDEAQAVFFYSDASSELMLVPHILFINLTGEKKSAYVH